MSLPNVCVVYLLRRGPAGEQVLLGRKRRGLGNGRIVGVGGKVEPGETLREGAVREVHEETGMIVEPMALQEVGVLDYLFPAHPAWSQRSHVFLCRSYQGEPVTTEEIEPAWYGIDEIPFERMWDDARRWLPAVLRGGTIRASFTFGDDLATVVDSDPPL